MVVLSPWISVKLPSPADGAGTSNNAAANLALDLSKSDSALATQGSGKALGLRSQQQQQQPQPCDWQLVTAHENGQLQVWDASLGTLQPIMRFGQTGNPCRQGYSVQLAILLHTSSDRTECCAPNT